LWVLNEGGVESLNGSGGALPLHVRLRFRNFPFSFSWWNDSWRWNCSRRNEIVQNFKLIWNGPMVKWSNGEIVRVEIFQVCEKVCEMVQVKMVQGDWQAKNKWSKLKSFTSKCFKKWYKLKWMLYLFKILFYCGC
jgi:hypothetical protein